MNNLTYKQALQKGLQKPIRNKAYLNYVASLPCVVCGHEPARKIWAFENNDLFSFPICAECSSKFALETIHQAVTDGVIDL